MDYSFCEVTKCVSPIVGAANETNVTTRINVNQELRVSGNSSLTARVDDGAIAFDGRR